MKRSFKKLMLKQIQENLNEYAKLTKTAIPKAGWARTIREALGITRESLAKRLKCSQANISSIEIREKKGTVNLNTLKKTASAMNCKLVYCLVPIKPLDKILEDQAKTVAKKQIRIINHSMGLENQALTRKQLKQQEIGLIQQLLLDNPSKLWK